MDKEKIFEIINDVENKSNKDLLTVLSELESEFENTKNLIVELTKHMEKIETNYNIVNNEIGKRFRK
jgi:flagellar biosynthesis chaperone FliJ